MDCKKLQGCKHGSCAEDANGVKKPHTCECDKDDKDNFLYEGPLCDKPICSADCSEEHGTCEEVSAILIK